MKHISNTNIKMEQHSTKVRLHGMWGSPYSKRVEIALKIKGIPYEYIEEDLWNKSELVLKYNPIHKKIPILVHDGKPICESLVILDYIEEVWPNAPKLFPEDPYLKARVRFWVNFIQQELFGNIAKVIRCDGEIQEKALKQVSEKLKVMEETMEEDIFPVSTNNNENKIMGILDIMMSFVLSSSKAIEEAIGVKIIDPKTTPFISAWITSLHQIPVVQETVAPHAKMVQLLQLIRENALRALLV